MKKGRLAEAILLYGPIAICLLVVLGALLFPTAVGRNFLFEYYWGPIVADAGGKAGDISPEYNWIDTLTYGLILAWAAYQIHRFFRSRNLRVGTRFFLALSPAILIGPAARVLEDMELFNEPLQYVFISPLIYIFLGTATFLLIAIADRIERMDKDRSRLWAATLVLVPGVIASIVLAIFPGWINADIPFWAPLLIGSSAAMAMYLIFKDPKYERTVGFAWGSALVMVALAYFLWFIDSGWRDHYVSLTGGNPSDLNIGGGALVLGLTLLSTAIVIASLALAGKKWPSLRKMNSAVNIMVIAGHMLDASATFIGVDRYGYDEKHVLPELLIERTGTAAVMYPLKLIFLLPALYYIDVSMAGSEEDNRHLVALVKLAILVLGFGPGTRDVIRLALGV